MIREMETIINAWNIAKDFIPIATALSVVVEITPIKINPWSKILKSVGKIMNQDLCVEMKNINEKLKVVSSRVDENEIDRIRYEILDFSNACRNNREHSKDQFQHVIDINKKYHKILEENGLENGIIDVEYDYILRVYKDCQDNGML